MNYIELCRKTSKAEDKAIDAFWKAVRSSCPEIKTNHLMTTDRRKLIETMQFVIREWYKLNNDECDSYYKRCCMEIINNRRLYG